VGNIAAGLSAEARQAARARMPLGGTRSGRGHDLLPMETAVGGRQGWTALLHPSREIPAARLVAHTYAHTYSVSVPVRVLVLAAY
jgi:hypothetical protein